MRTILMLARFFLLLAPFLTTTLLPASDWCHWRGPTYNGSTDETNLPHQWSQTENIRWMADLPGRSAATPIICSDAVFISSTDPDSNQLLALCYDRSDGQLRWRQSVAEGLHRDTRSTFAAPSPVTDGEIVIFFYGSGPLAAFDMQGKKIWQRNVQQEYGEFAFGWTFSSSPLLYDGKLYLQVLQRDVPVRGSGAADHDIQSYLLALDPHSGRELWRVVRPSDAYAESREAFTSPIPFTFEGRSEILIAGGDCLTGHDPQTGKELWRWGTWNPQRIGHWRLVPSPVTGGGVVLACAPKRDPIYAIKAGGTGMLDDGAIAWVSRETREISSDVPTPAYYDGDFFVLSDVRKCLSRVEPGTGSAKWTIPLPSREKFEASPLAADGRIFMVNFAGLVVVVDARDGKVLQQIEMAQRTQDPIRSSISAAGGNLFLRTNDKLYCIGP